MTNVDDLIVESIINDDGISEFNTRLDRYDGEINEADAAVIAQYSENLSSRAVDDMHDSIENLLDENHEALENSQRIGIDNNSEIRVSQEMIQRLGGDVDRVERKVDSMGMSLSYEGSYEGEDGGLPGFRGGGKGKRRDVLGLIAAVTGIGSLTGVGYLATQQGAEGNLDDGTLQEGEWYSFSDVSECLSPSQERKIESASERYTGDGLNQTSYKFEKSGDSRDQGWDIYVADSNGQEEFGKLEGQDIYCEVN